MAWVKWLSSWILALPILLASMQAGASASDWVLFKERFVRPDGRVVDTGNASVSHTEGQGITMLLAERNGDRDTFDAVWLWTQSHLQVREDKLLAWRWTASEGVADKNNATDGDLFVAWALLRAHRRWSQPEHLVAAREIMQAIRLKVVRVTSRGMVLLPGVEGFTKPDGTVINLSYWVFPALQAFAQADPSPEWKALQESGLHLLLEARFGRWGLPADWTMLGDKMTPAPEPRFGYDAVRIPLYILWAQLETQISLKPFQDYWDYFKGAQFLPPWTNVVDNSVDSYNASLGIRSIARMTLAFPKLSSLDLPPLDSSQDYYSAVLLLLTKMALAERSL